MNLISKRLNTIFLGMVAISLFTYSASNILLPNGFGIDQASPTSKLDVNGNMSVGTTYSGTNAAPTNGAIVEGNVGVGVTSPKTKIDIGGDLALREYSQDIGTNAGTNNFNDLAINSDNTFIRVTGPDNNYEITGITGGVDGRVLILYNSTLKDMKFKNDDILSAAANRIYGYDYADVTVRKLSTATLVYSSIDSRWLVLGKF